MLWGWNVPQLRLCFRMFFYQLTFIFSSDLPFIPRQVFPDVPHQQGRDRAHRPGTTQLLIPDFIRGIGLSLELLLKKIKMIIYIKFGWKIWFFFKPFQNKQKKDVLTSNRNDRRNFPQQNKILLNFNYFVLINWSLLLVYVITLLLLLLLLYCNHILLWSDTFIKQILEPRLSPHITQ